MASLLNSDENMQNITSCPNMENMTFYDFITFAIHFVRLPFLF